MAHTQTAQLNYLRIAPRKVRAIAATLKGLSVVEAEAQLMLQRRRAALPLLKLLRSAVASAKNNQRLDAHKLYVVNVVVNHGPMLKRFLPRARGMATPIQKKMSHVTLTLAENPLSTTPRFTITTRKKVKLPPAKPRRQKKEVEKEQGVTPKRTERGFFKKMFRRKSV